MLFLLLVVVEDQSCSRSNEQKKTQPRNRLQKENRSTHKDQKILKTNGFINFHINLKMKKTRHCIEQ
jgi:hypothetical protein